MSKYQETAERIIEVLKSDEFELDMLFFNSSDGKRVEHDCGTTFCLAGWLAYKDGYPEEYSIDGWFDHTEYSEDLVGGGSWEFLFGGRWSNDRTKAKARAQYVIDNDDCPNFSEWGKYE